MALSSEELLNITTRGVENGGKVRGSHLDGDSLLCVRSEGERVKNMASVWS